MENNKVVELVQELESALGNINLNKETLNDMQTELTHLREDMDNTKTENVTHAFIIQFHRKVRVLDDLMSYLVGDLNDNYGKTEEIKQALFEKVVRNEE